MRMKHKHPEWLSQWLSARVEDAHFSVRPIQFSQSREWMFRDGALTHKTGKFFQVVGTCFIDQEGSAWYQPLLKQREIGTLGFLLREHNQRKEILVQAKGEPGNVGVVQLSPTCQATASNLARAHGGDNPPYADIFSKSVITVLHESLQSEQGSRFLGKFNRNICALTHRQEEMVLEATHRWIPTDDFLSLLHSDFLINTDARSVLVTSPWEALVGRHPFTRFQDSFSQELSVSAVRDFDRETFEEMLNNIEVQRKWVRRATVLALEDTQRWTITDESIQSSGGDFSVRQIAVSVHGREVEHWDQPIVDSASEGEILLACGRKDGVLHFLFRLRSEPGFDHGMEFGPTEVRLPGSMEDSVAISGRIVAECRQSEEGGRFFHDSNRYAIIDIGEAKREKENEYWLTLAQTQVLLQRGRWLTNEARSVLSLLLPWL